MLLSFSTGPFRFLSGAASADLTVILICGVAYAEQKERASAGG